MIDLSRPPVRPGPRLAGWVIFVGVLAVSFAVLALDWSLLAQPPATQPGVVTPAARVALLALATVGLIVLLTFWYAANRLTKGRSVWSNTLLAKGYPVGDPESGRRRQSDPEERAAWKRFKRGEITRIDYERRMAYRRFVHGEVSIEEYHEILQELTSAIGGTPPRTGIVTEHEKDRLQRS
ncbi:MAG: hypothetical protein ACLPWO_07905 [Thermoplasmata archaeon]